MVYAKEPLGGPEAVLDYLGRYTHRVAISNERIVGIDGNDVLLRVRADGESGRQRTERFGIQLIQRKVLYSTSCRAASSASAYYGLLAPARRTHLAAARAALGAPLPQPVVIESVAAFLHRVSHIEYGRRPHLSAPASFASSRIRRKLACPIGNHRFQGHQSVAYRTGQTVGLLVRHGIEPRHAAALAGSPSCAECRRHRQTLLLRRLLITSACGQVSHYAPEGGSCSVASI